MRDTNRDRRFEIETGFDTATIDIGASVSHAGCCLTVVEKGPGWFAVEVSGETLSMSTLDEWAEGRRYLGLDVLARAQAVDIREIEEVINELTPQAITA